jgi:hypothetical protein
VAFPASGRGAVRALPLYAGGGNQSNQLPPAMLEEAAFLAETGIFHKPGILPSISNNFHMHSLSILICSPSLEQ